MAHLSGYAEPIFIACLLFLPAAALFTLPFMVLQYRKYGSIPFLRAVIVYAFILYMMCSFMLTVLPLPSESRLAALPDMQLQLIPFSTYADMLRSAGFTFFDPGSFFSLSVWKKLVTSSGLFEILANIVMQIPLGVFLRYYFRRNRKQVLLIGFCVSLFYELTQLSGLFFLYPKPYRLCSVDDLIDNTLGAMIGYGITPVLCSFLPTRDRLDEISVARSRKITWVRRVTSAILDWLVYFVIAAAVWFFARPDADTMAAFLALTYPIWVALLFVLCQKRFHGQTPGKALLKLRLVSEDIPGSLTCRRLLIRYGLIYIAMPVAILATAAVLIPSMVMAIFSDVAIRRLLGLLITMAVIAGWALWLTQTLKTRHALPHRYMSHTDIVKE